MLTNSDNKNDENIYLAEKFIQIPSNKKKLVARYDKFLTNFENLEANDEILDCKIRGKEQIC